MKEKEPVYFLGLELENVRCFGEKAKLDLSDGKGNWRKWTVILGDNGTGKTTLLQIVSGLEQEKQERIYTGEYEGQNERKTNLYSKIFLNQFFKLNFISEKSATATIKAIVNDNLSFLTTGGFHLLVSQHKGHLTSETYPRPIDSFEELIIFGYGANRFMSLKSISENESENSETLFNDDAKLINAEEWLLNMDYAASRESNLKIFAEQRKKLIIEILLDLLPDIKAINFTTPTKEKLTPSVEFLTEYDYWVSIHQLNLGYKTMVAWMVDLAARMFKRYPESDNPLKEPAIVLVDEIDLHMHPKWQRKIFDYLSDIFPATQFIVTAHSPLIVQSAPKDANIVVLRKEGDHVIIDNDVKSVQTWRLDQILSSDLFGIEGSRSPEVETWLEERKSLIQKEKLTESEKERLGELNKKANSLPTADNENDIKAMQLIRDAAEYLKAQNA